jgi:hypothetical protein
MLGALVVLVVLVPTLVATVVLAVRLRHIVRRGGARALVAGTRRAWRQGSAGAVLPGIVAVAAGAAVLTFALQCLYLAAVANSPRWGFDVALLGLVLAPLMAVVMGALAGLAAAAVGRSRGFGAGTVAGLLTVVAVAAGTAAVHLPLRMATVAEPDRFPQMANLAVGELLLPFDVLLAALAWALPWPVLGAALGAGTRPAPRLDDRWQLLLDLATADLPHTRAAWGAALRAELAAIEPRAERRSFALGGTWASVRSGSPAGAWTYAVGVAAIVGAGSVVASRWSLAHDRGGVLDVWVTFPSLLLFAVALAVARKERSFGSGLRTAAVSGLAALAAVLVVGVPEAIVWADEQAGYLTTGDAVPPSRQSAVRDLLRPEFLLAMTVTWTMTAVAGSTLGATAGRLRERSSEDLVPTTDAG